MVGSARYQSGAALIFALIFLLLLSIIGVTAMQSSTLEERMAGNVRDTNLAFQAAELALRTGEQQMDAVNIPTFSATGPFRQPIVSATIASTWDAYNWSADSTLVTTSLSGIDSTNNPRYVVEQVVSSAALASSGSAVDLESVQKMETPTVYRITAKGVGSSGKSVVILQSTFRRHL